MNKIGGIALSQIVILVIGVIAIGYAIGSSIGEVGAADPVSAVSTVGSGPGVTGSLTVPGATVSTGGTTTSTTTTSTGFLGMTTAQAVVAIGAVVLLVIGTIVGGHEGQIISMIGSSAGAAVGATLLIEGLAPLLATGIGAAVFVVLTFLYKRVDQEVVIVDCRQWDAPTGGDECQKCNKQGDLPCSEYQCRSLGQSCELINQGTGEEQCITVNVNDVNPPTIQAFEGALIDENYGYDPAGITFPNREDRGVWLEYHPAGDKGCMPAFTPFSFGIELKEEPGRCSMDVLRKDTFEEMSIPLSGGISLYNHSYTMSLPGTYALEAENLTVHNNGDYDLYIRCQDANGNTNVGTFVIKYCVQKGPDTTAPLIVGTSPMHDSAVGFEVGEVDFITYVNEPVEECRWSHEDKSISNMEGEMTCASSLTEMNSQMVYRCDTKLEGIKDRVKNNFYIRCRDKAGNENTESNKITLIGTQPLFIDAVEPSGVVKDSTDAVKVTLEAETSAGYKDGEAECSYGLTEQAETDVFSNTGTYRHSQDLWLAEGDYEFYIRCVDAGGNTDTEKVEFTVETDTEAPTIVRAFKEEFNLRIITSEAAECVYNKAENYKCDYTFEEGLNMITTGEEDIDHFVDWNPNINYYIKCRDKYGNQPSLSDQCSMIVTPFELNQ